MLSARFSAAVYRSDNALTEPQHINLPTHKSWDDGDGSAFINRSLDDGFL